MQATPYQLSWAASVDERKHGAKLDFGEARLAHGGAFVVLGEGPR